MTSPNFATLSESPIIRTLFIIGTAGAGAERFLSLGAATTNTTSTRASTSASGLSNARASDSQSFLPRALGVSGFILDANVGFQVDMAGIGLLFYCTPNRAVKPPQLKLVTPADVKSPEWLPVQANVSRMHHEDLFLPIAARDHLFHVVNKSD